MINSKCLYNCNDCLKINSFPNSDCCFNECGMHEFCRGCMYDNSIKILEENKHDNNKQMGFEVE